MTEFLIPMSCSKTGVVICVGFAGLNEEKYDKLEIALDDGEFQTVERDAENPFASEPVTFDVQESDIIYAVHGRITIGEWMWQTKAMVTAVVNEANNEPEPVFMPSVTPLLKKGVQAKLMSDTLEEKAQEPQYHSGALASKPTRPIAEDD